MAAVITGRVALIDDHALVRESLAQTLVDVPGLDVRIVHQGARVQPVLALDPAPDLVLLDLDLGDHQVSADDVSALMRRGSRVLVVSALGSPATVSSLVNLGVAGFLSKREDSDSLIAAVTAVLVGGTWTTPELAGILVSDAGTRHPRFSPQEQRVLVLYASGLKLDAVAHQLGIRPGTVREYLERIRAKYDAAGRAAHSKTDLYREALRDGLLGTPN